MSENCYFCKEAVNPHDVSTWKQVLGWVGGPRKDGMTLREDTKVYAHNHCVQKAREGQSVDQLEIFDEDDRITGDNAKLSLPSIEEVFRETGAYRD